jgi:integrase
LQALRSGSVVGLHGKANMSKVQWKQTKVQFLLKDEISGRYYARFYQDGKSVWRTLKTDVFEVAKYRLAEKLKASRSVAKVTKTVELGKGTVEQVAKLYLAKVSNDPSIKETTRHYYEQIVKAILESWPELKTAKPKDISKADCEAWAKRYSDQYSIPRYNNSIDCLRKIFDVAIEQGTLYRNPAADLTKQTPERKHIELPSPEEFAAIVKSVRGAGSGWSDPCADLIEFLAFTGCRIKEAKNVKWDDVKTNGIWIHGGEIGTKSRESRFLPMNTRLETLIADLRANPRYRRTSRDDQHLLAVSECQKAINSACTRLNVKRFTHHDLRHLFATRAIESGIDVPTVANWLGHKDGGALLMKTYSHLLLIGKGMPFWM